MACCSGTSSSSKRQSSPSGSAWTRRSSGRKGIAQTRDEYAMRVLTALNAGGGKITYEYDFGAGWVHEIALQKKVPREPGADYPFCVK